MKKFYVALVLLLVLGVLTACTESSTTSLVDSNEQTTTIGEEVEVVSVMDGDTMKVKYKGEERKVRFLLIDAPEMYHKTLGEQPYGKEAQQLNRDLLDKAKSVTIEFDETGDKEDKYDRLLAYVYADGKSVQKQLIESGYVRVGYVYNQKAAHLAEYEEAQKKAKDANKGIWQYPGYVTDRGFVKEKVPNWSPGKSLPETDSSASNSSSTTNTDSSCSIKGNINAKGNKTYFIKGDTNYEQVKEEKIFCSEEEAEQAGFKHAS
ncbi:MAG: thermonuclease family protein [Kurthia sp.]|nr:thermonuclease family protein [Candidatus Kurthia equi]